MAEIDDKAKIKSEAVPVEERDISTVDMEVFRLQNDQPGKAEDVPEVRGEASDQLTRQPFLNSSDNPFEMIVASCSKCFSNCTDHRYRLQELGWRLFVDLRYEDHPGFEVCPTCAEREYSWEDLY